MTVFFYYDSKGKVAMYSQTSLATVGNLTEISATITDADYTNLTVNNYDAVYNGTSVVITEKPDVTSATTRASSISTMRSLISSATTVADVNVILSDILGLL